MKKVFCIIAITVSLCSCIGQTGEETEKDYAKEHDVHTTLRENEVVDTTQSVVLELKGDSMILRDPKTDTVRSRSKIIRKN